MSSIFLLSNTFKDIKTQTLKNNTNLQVLENDIQISSQDEMLSGKYQNIIFSFGVNDIQLNDITSRDKEAMQTQYIGLSQTIPLGDKLKLKQNIDSIQKDIITFLIKDKKVKYNSEILSLLNQYTILDKKINLYDKIQTNIQQIIYFQKQKFKLTSSQQTDIIKNRTKILSLTLKIENLKHQQNIIKLKLQNISYTKQKHIIHNLSDMTIPSLDFTTLLHNNNIYKALQYKIIKSDKNIKYQQSLKTSDLKLNVSYSQRENFEDYLSFSLSYPLPIYGREDIKIKKVKVQKSKNKLLLEEFKNEFEIKIDTLIQQMKIAKISYDILISSILQQNVKIDKLLKSYSVQKGINSILQLKNKNKILQTKIKAYDEKMRFYKAKASLAYYQGKTL
jgi:hypothetical protein